MLPLLDIRVMSGCHSFHLRTDRMLLLRRNHREAPRLRPYMRFPPGKTFRMYTRHPKATTLPAPPLGRVQAWRRFRAQMAALRNQQTPLHHYSRPLLFPLKNLLTLSTREAS